jgi:hypothetical protein
VQRANALQSCPKILRAFLDDAPKEEEPLASTVSGPTPAAEVAVAEALLRVPGLGALQTATWERLHFRENELIDSMLMFHVSFCWMICFNLTVYHQRNMNT